VIICRYIDLKDIDVVNPSAAGKILLQQIVNELKLDLHLDRIKYDIHERPYFANNGFDFNISHSEDKVVCCGTLTGRVGVDIEKVKRINLTDYTDYFSAEEWQKIDNANDPTSQFYNYWTRKEAVLKADGTGWLAESHMMDVQRETVEFNGKKYHLSAIDIGIDYQSHIAAEVQQPINLLELKH